jgi:DNA-3-methyladenine glycosylase
MSILQKSPLIIAGDKTNISDLQLFPEDILQSEDTVSIARSLVGAHLITSFEGKTTGGRIIETEAYKAPEDKASHAHLNRRTERTEVMFGKAGTAYIYLCYGIHHLFNVVSGPKGKAHAILIRALEPIWGIDIMKKRRGLTNLTQLTNGPGKLSEALNIKTAFTGRDLLEESSTMKLYEAEDKNEVSLNSAKRIGVDYAEESKDWPWRFYDAQSKFVSKR